MCIGLSFLKMCWSKITLAKGREQEKYEDFDKNLVDIKVLHTHFKKKKKRFGDEPEAKVR